MKRTKQDLEKYKPNSSIRVDASKIVLSEKDKKPACQHQFFKLADEVRTKEENMTRVTTRSGIRVMCALCGQQRILWMDGEVETV